MAHLFRGEFEAAAEWAERSTHLPNAQYWSLANLAVALAHLGRRAESVAAGAQLLQRRPDFSCRFARLHLSYIRDPERLEAYIKGLRMAGIPDTSTPIPMDS